MKSHLEIWSLFAQHFGADPRSVAALNKRATEGLHLLTVRLPVMAKAVDTALTTLCYIHPVESGFKRKRQSALPVFLYELFSRCFTDLGTLKQDVNVDHITQLRQILYLFYKFEVDFDDEQTKDAELAFVERDKGVVGSCVLPDSLVNRFNSLLPHDPYDVVFHHASGATADGLDTGQRRQKFRWVPSLMEVFQLDDFVYDVQHGLETFLELTAEGRESHRLDGSVPIVEPPAKLSFVPKDSRGPRVICMEPHERMYVQKGYQTYLYSYIETESPARGYINFVDQTINRDLARRASRLDDYATIDLKDASDMVSWSHIRALLHDSDWLPIFTATRTPVVKLPTLGNYQLNKYAPMGSALCFPVEAMFFWSIAKEVADECYVYGDDLIVKREFANDVIVELERYGLIVNRSKSLTHGFFKESCGGEYFYGGDISYIKLKSYSLDRFVAFANLVGRRHSHLLSDDIIRWYEKTHRVAIYRGSPSMSGFSEPCVYYGFGNNNSFKKRYDKDTQSTLVRRLTVRSRQDCDLQLSERARLHDWFTNNVTKYRPFSYLYDRLYNPDFIPEIDRCSLSRVERGVTYGSVKTKVCYRWIPERGSLAE
jgi:hypothetical protein